MDSKNINDWTDEELSRVVNVFAWLLKEDKKQNPDLYKILPLETGSKTLSRFRAKRINILSDS